MLPPYKILSLVLVFTLISSGCYSTRNIPKAQLERQAWEGPERKHVTYQVELTSPNQQLVFQKITLTRQSLIGEKKGSPATEIPFTQVKSLEEKELHPGMTMFGIFGGIRAVIGVATMVALSSLSGMGG